MLIRKVSLCWYCATNALQPTIKAYSQASPAIAIITIITIITIVLAMIVERMKPLALMVAVLGTCKTSMQMVHSRLLAHDKQTNNDSLRLF